MAAVVNVSQTQTDRLRLKINTNNAIFLCLFVHHYGEQTTQPRDARQHLPHRADVVKEILAVESQEYKADLFFF